MAIVLKHGVPSAPMPGQSWTKPIGTHAFQRPPKMVDPEEAANEIWTRIMQKQNFASIVALLKSGTPIVTLTISILMNAVISGMFTMDVAMIIKDVVASQIQAIAKKAGIDYRFNNDNQQPGQSQFENVMNRQQKYEASMRTPEQPQQQNPFAPSQQNAGFMSAPQGMNANG